MEKGIFYRGLLIAAVLAFSRPAYAATLSSFPVMGAERIRSPADINSALEAIPECVAQYFISKGGRIYIVSYSLDSMAWRNRLYTKDVFGLYFYKSHKIYAKYTGDWFTGKIIAHELGHFLYRETRPSWSIAAKNRFLDEEEFAGRYARRHPEDEPYLIEIEETAGRLLFK